MKRLAAALVPLLPAACAHAPLSTASVRCAHTGPPGNQLRLMPYADRSIDLDFADATVRRAGNRILVLGEPAERSMGSVRCAGPRPTVSNTKALVFLQRGLSFGTLDLSGGLPAPRTVFHSARGALAYGQVEGDRAADRWTIAGVARAFGLRLNGSRSGPFDVVLDGPGKKVFVAEPQGGEDRVDASRVRHRGGLVFLKGGPGDDTLIGSPFRDALDGGPGSDILAGGAGLDQLFARDGRRDGIRCGPGKDSVFADSRDVVSGCEKWNRAIRPEMLLRGVVAEDHAG